MNTKALDAVALSVRSLSMDAIQKANSGHPGLPLGTAELGALLYGEIMKSDPVDPDWIDRDRFVLSAGHGSMFLYSMLYLAGYPVKKEDIMNFRQVGSVCAGHPEYGLIKGIEATTGPLGQGVSMAVGMAIAESMLAARFNTASRKIIDHITYVLAGDGCMMEGIASEASSLAGHLGLGKLIVFYDSNSITIDGSTNVAFTEDVAARYRAYGWQTYEGSMYDYAGIMEFVEKAKADPAKPTLIKLTSIIGKGSPNKQGTNSIHGSPLGPDEIVLAKKGLGIPEGEQFYVHPDALVYFAEKRKAQATAHAAWKKEFDAWTQENPALKAELDAFYAGKPTAEVKLPTYKEGDKVATRNASGSVLQVLSAAYPELVGGSADLTSPNCTALPKEAGVYDAKNRAGRMIHFGIREHAMAAISNGIALHGGLVPFCATFLVFSDYLRPSLRLSALMGKQVVYVLTHDSVFVGEDGPTHQPIENLASLRAMPNVRVLRPADAEETEAAWQMALARRDGPTVLVLSRQNLLVFHKDAPDWKETIRTGAYVPKQVLGKPDVVVVATGSEVELALAAAAKVPEKKVAVVSMISRELFLAQDKKIRETIIPAGVRTVTVEAGVAMGWEAIATSTEDILSIDRFGESGPGDKVAVELGISVDRLVEALKK